MQEAIIRLIYGAVVLLGWGLSTFLMGLIGKQMHHSAALFYNLVGTIIVVLCFSDQLRYGWSLNHFYGIAAGSLICLADWAYYKLADHGMVRQASLVQVSSFAGCFFIGTRVVALHPHPSHPGCSTLTRANVREESDRRFARTALHVCTIDL